VTPDKADYSPARNSCVAELETVYYSSRTARENLSVQDLLSGETLFSANCAKDCEIPKLTFVDPAFDYVMNNPSEPLELEKAYAQMESEMPPSGFIPDAPASQHKSAPPSRR
jgi:hypothetical protein